MKTFRQRFRAVIAKSEYRDSYRRLALDAGLSESRISNILNDQSLDTSTNGPGIFLMRRVADCLGCSLDFLVGRENTPFPQGGVAKIDTPEARLLRALKEAQQEIFAESDAPTAKTFNGRYVNGGGQLSAIFDLLEYVDLYDWPPQGGKITVRRVGSKSLSALTMGAPEAEILQGAIDAVSSTDLHQKLLADFSAAHHNGKYGSIEELDLTMPNKPLRVRLIYSRELYSMKDENGKNVIVNFCQRIL